MFHEQVLSRNQENLASSFLAHFRDFFLVGGTAIALLLGHRRSIDFDLASPNPIRSFDLERKIKGLHVDIGRIVTAGSDELSLFIDDVLVTFFSYPFPVEPKLLWPKNGLKMPDILSLAAMKAYALGRRNVWKDYVDLYFILKDHSTVEKIIEKAEKIFLSNFNSRLFLEQLCYFEDIDFSGEMDYLGTGPDDEEIKVFLTDCVRII